MDIKERIYDECMRRAEEAGKQTKITYSYDRKTKTKRAHYDVGPIRQWIDLQIAHDKGLVSNLEVLDCFNLGYVPEHIKAMMDTKY